MLTKFRVDRGNAVTTILLCTEIITGLFKRITPCLLNTVLWLDNLKIGSHVRYTLADRVSIGVLFSARYFDSVLFVDLGLLLDPEFSETKIKPNKRPFVNGRHDHIEHVGK